MYDTCHVTGDYHQKLKPAPEPLPEQFDLFSDFDKLSIDIDPKSIEPLSHNFRSRLKKIAMAPKYSVPIQIIREQTLRGKGTQNLATRSWNLLTGLYYKAGDIPWILGGLDAKTCFLGVSFFHKKSAERDLVLSSMSHLFANDFNSVILRGEQVAYDYALKSPVLTADSAVRIAERALQEFWSARRAYPERIVVHKTSMFNDDVRSRLDNEVAPQDYPLGSVSCAAWHRSYFRRLACSSVHEGLRPRLADLPRLTCPISLRNP
jgi:hypothetical protein